jgi:proteasome lid subunit RPN8/RPN11
VEPKLIYDRFNKVETSTKKIVFPKDLSELFWNIFQTASGKEIMFYGEMIQSEEDKDLYTVSGMNFPPQKNYGGYVETVDGKYETWVFNEIILKGKKIPLHVHTHPDFSAFSSSVDERQIKQYIEDNEGNPFVVQLIVSNPRKGSYFIRWFDLENDTWERPNVEFTFDKYDVEAEFPGIFQFDAPPRVTSSPSSRLSDFNYKSWYSDFKGRGFYEDDEDEDHEEAKDLYHDEDGEDLSDPKEFDKYFSKNYKKLIKN